MRKLKEVIVMSSADYKNASFLTFLDPEGRPWIIGKKTFNKDYYKELGYLALKEMLVHPSFYAPIGYFYDNIGVFLLYIQNKEVFDLIVEKSIFMAHSDDIIYPQIMGQATLERAFSKWIKGTYDRSRKLVRSNAIYTLQNDFSSNDNDLTITSNTDIEEYFAYVAKLIKENFDLDFQYLNYIEDLSKLRVIRQNSKMHEIFTNKVKIELERGNRFDRNRRSYKFAEKYFYDCICKSKNISRSELARIINDENEMRLYWSGPLNILHQTAFVEGLAEICPDKEIFSGVGSTPFLHRFPKEGPIDIDVKKQLKRALQNVINNITMIPMMTFEIFEQDLHNAVDLVRLCYENETFLNAIKNVNMKIDVIRAVESEENAEKLVAAKSEQYQIIEDITKKSIRKCILKEKKTDYIESILTKILDIAVLKSTLGFSDLLLLLMSASTYYKLQANRKILLNLVKKDLNLG